MSDNQEALRLADALERRGYTSLTMNVRLVDREIAAELRRLHAKCEALTADTLEEMDRITEIHRLLTLNAELVEALRRCRNMVAHPDNLAFIDAALAKVEASK